MYYTSRILVSNGRGGRHYDFGTKIKETFAYNANTEIIFEGNEDDLIPAPGKFTTAQYDPTAHVSNDRVARWIEVLENFVPITPHEEELQEIVHRILCRRLKWKPKQLSHEYQVGEYGSFDHQSGVGYDRYWEMINEGHSLADWRYVIVYPTYVGELEAVFADITVSKTIRDFFNQPSSVLEEQVDDDFQYWSETSSEGPAGKMLKSMATIRLAASHMALAAANMDYKTAGKLKTQLRKEYAKFKKYQRAYEKYVHPADE